MWVDTRYTNLENRILDSLLRAIGDESVQTRTRFYGLALSSTVHSLVVRTHSPAVLPVTRNHLDPRDFYGQYEFCSPSLVLWGPLSEVEDVTSSTGKTFPGRRVSRE